MRILLATPYLSWHDSGLLVAKSIVDLQHPIFLWDFRVTPVPPPVGYDLALVGKGESIDPELLKRPRVLIWNDNTFRYPIFSKIAPLYDRVYTLNKDEPSIPNCEWLPMGCDKDIHRPLPVKEQFDVIFAGTANSPKKAAFIRSFMRKFKGRFGLFGANWEAYGMRAQLLPHFLDFAAAISSAKIALNLHWDLFGVGPNRKISEISGTGKALLVTDRVKGLDETYPMAPSFTSLEECLELVRHYLDHEEERKRLVSELQKVAYERFTYKHQLKRILDEVEA